MELSVFIVYEMMCKLSNFSASIKALIQSAVSTQSFFYGNHFIAKPAIFWRAVQEI
jgi:hypothetical protein